MLMVNQLAGFGVGGGAPPFSGARYWRIRPLSFSADRWDIRGSAANIGIYESSDETGTDIAAPLSYGTNGFQLRTSSGSGASVSSTNNPFSTGNIFEGNDTSASLWFDFGAPVIIGSMGIENPSFNSHNRFPLSAALEYQETDDYTGTWTTYATLNSASGNETKSYRNIVEGAVVTAT